ncbi:hypothetical protein GCM10028801_14020 [Nocardioides maradonensis]
MRNRILTLIALVVAILVPTLGPGLPTATALTDPMYGAPAVGQCYNMAGSLVISSESATAPTVPCSGQHTVVITAVAQMPATMTYSGTAFATFLSKTCLPATVRASGGSKLRYGRSSYADYVFIPTTAQQDQGAHWVTCMMGIAQGSTVLRITGRYPHLPSNLPPRLTFCLTGRDLMTNCAATHKWHPVTATTVTASQSYIDNKAVAVCRSRLGRTGWLATWKRVAPMTTWVVSCMRS